MARETVSIELYPEIPKYMSVITQFDGLLVTIGDGQDGQDIHPWTAKRHRYRYRCRFGVGRLKLKTAHRCNRLSMARGH
jgi:hypothetical protein